MAWSPLQSHSLKICIAGAPQKRRPKTAVSSAGEIVPSRSRSKRSKALRMALSHCSKRWPVAAARNSLRSISQSLTRSMLSKMRCPSSWDTPRVCCSGPVNSAAESVPLPSVSNIWNCASARSTSAPVGAPSAYTNKAAAARLAGLSCAKSTTDCNTSSENESCGGRSTLRSSQRCRKATAAVGLSAGHTRKSCFTNSLATSLMPSHVSPSISGCPLIMDPVISTSVLPRKGFMPVRRQ
mmetsp:Transcript_65376/g.181359  ORF Transcript_65376/g.181359 Transcript_65376/m.181359 type:complete len:239 (-) Transcript_65376:921-1637(-)